MGDAGVTAGVDAGGEAGEEACVAAMPMRAEAPMPPMSVAPTAKTMSTTATSTTAATVTEPMARGGTNGWVFVSVVAALFIASVTATLLWCASMSAMGGMPMPGGWTMSMAWRPMCGQTWPGVAASFVGMWAVMMVAMMLPSLTPVLWRYRLTLDEAGAKQLGRLTACVGIGYFFVWSAFGWIAFALGVALTSLEMRFPALALGVPFAVGLVVLGGGALQLTQWKARRLACCRRAPTCGQILPVDARSAWRHGVRVGLHCSDCCAGFTAILLVSGVMDWRVMTAVTVAITAERVAPGGERIARAIGVVVVGIGVLLVAQAAGLA